MLQHAQLAICITHGPDVIQENHQQAAKRRANRAEQRWRASTTRRSRAAAAAGAASPRAAAGTRREAAAAAGTAVAAESAHPLPIGRSVRRRHPQDLARIERRSSSAMRAGTRAAMTTNPIRACRYWGSTDLQRRSADRASSRCHHCLLLLMTLDDRVRRDAMDLLRPAAVATIATTAAAAAVVRVRVIGTTTAVLSRVREAR